MVGKTLTLIGSSAKALKNSLISAVLVDGVPEEERPATISLTFAEILKDQDVLKSCDVAWVHLDEEQPSGLFSVLGVLQDRHAMALLTRPNESLPLGAPIQEGIAAAPAEAGPEAIRALLRVLWCQGAVIGTLQREIRVLRAHQGGLSDQMDRIDEELRLAAQLQRECLPSCLPRVGPLDFKVLFRPAGYVGGDIYDVIRLDEEHVGIFIADAVGHGVPAALMTMYIKRALRTKEPDPTNPQGYRLVPPDEALSRLNRDMAEHQNAGKINFATACYGVVNCRTLELSVARGGHPFPLLLHADGKHETISPDGAMLGVFPAEVFELAQIRLKPGDRLIFYSDGFELAFPPIEGSPEAQADTLNEAHTDEFRLLAHGPLDEALARLVERLDEATGSLNQQDDMTVVCLDVTRVEAIPGSSTQRSGLLEEQEEALRTSGL